MNTLKQTGTWIYCAIIALGLFSRRVRQIFLQQLASLDIRKPLESAFIEVSNE